MKDILNYGNASVHAWEQSVLILQNMPLELECFLANPSTKRVGVPWLTAQKKEELKKNAPVLYSVANTILLSEEVPPKLKTKTLEMCAEWVIESAAILAEGTLLPTLYK